MRIGVITLGSKTLAPIVAVAMDALKELGHDAEDVSDLPYSLSNYDFLIFFAQTKGLFGAIPFSITQGLAKCVGLQGKRCLAMMRRGGLRPESALQKCMNALEHEGLVVVEGEVFTGNDSVATIVRNAPLRRA